MLDNGRNSTVSISEHKWLFLYYYDLYVIIGCSGSRLPVYYSPYFACFTLPLPMIRRVLSLYHSIYLLLFGFYFIWAQISILVYYSSSQRWREEKKTADIKMFILFDWAQAICCTCSVNVYILIENHASVDTDWSPVHVHSSIPFHAFVSYESAVVCLSTRYTISFLPFGLSKWMVRLHKF